MRNTGFSEHPSDAAETQRFVEADHGDLRVEIDMCRAIPFRRYNGPLQKFCSDPFMPIAFEHGHASDLRLRLVDDHSRGSHDPAVDRGHEVNRAAIVAVQLDVLGDALFLDKNTHADGESLLQFSDR